MLKMKLKRISLFFISFLCASLLTWAQEKEEKNKDSISQETKYGLRVGADLAKPLRTLLEEGYSGFELMGDFRFSEKFYLAAEIGNEKKDYFEPTLNARTSGSYIKLGADLNMYNNWLGLNNAIYAGLRYGFSTFKQELIAYEVYTTTQNFPASSKIVSQEFSGLSAHWAELIVGVKTEVLTNVYISINLQLKRKISEDKPDNFDNLYIPGYHRTYDFSEFGVGYSYSISYLIPFFKK